MNEQDIAGRIASHLDRGVKNLKPGLVGRLHEARFTALSRVPVRELRLAPAAGKFSGWDRHTVPFWRTMLVALMLSAVFAVFNFWQQNTDVDDDGGQLDAKLLSSELPPQAFAQKDFGAWLQETR